jgi:hypothetical protein
MPDDGLTDLVEHLRDCRKADAALVVDGNADDVIANLLAAGWTWSTRQTDYIGTKRIRYLTPPGGKL